jgi:hypothetical protein
MKMRLVLPFQLRSPFSKPATVALNEWCVMYDAQNTQARTGSSPSGTMTAELSSTDTIRITYNIPSGIQAFYHDNPGKVYAGITRVAYLPNNDEGRQLLTRLKYAWQHGLIFNVGTSLTTVSRLVFVYTAASVVGARHTYNQNLHLPIFYTRISGPARCGDLVKNSTQNVSPRRPFWFARPSLLYGLQRSIGCIAGVGPQPRCFKGMYSFLCPSISIDEC